MRLTEDGSVQDHVRCMVEIFQELAAVGSPIEEEDKVVHLLASLPESFETLVTALEAHVDVPKMDAVIECMLHEEIKKSDRVEGI